MSFFILALISGSVVGLDNGAARTPPMGWNPYSVHSCQTTEDQYHAAAQALVLSGLRDVGYKNFNLDCGWLATNRTSSGLITWDTTRIPSGIPALADYVHGLGLLFGLYNDAGYFSCDSVGGAEHRIGSLGHEASDARMFVEWQVNYLKCDNCFAVSQSDFADFNPPIREQDNFQRMRDALSSLGSNMVYSICEWGIQDPARWAGAIANSWRISNDLGSPPSFEDLKRVINQFVPITTFSRPGSWNDLDLLQVGNVGMTEAEWGMQFAFWAAAKSPLLVSTDLTSASAEVLNILANKWIIDVNQDPLGAAISFMRRYTNLYDVWSGPLADGSTVVVLVNWMGASQTITFNLSDVYLASAGLTDLWTGTDLGTVNGWTTDTVDAHGALIYKLSNTVAAAPQRFTTYVADASSNVLAGGATIRPLDDYTNVVYNIGYGGTLSFIGVDGGSSGGTKLLELSYVNADYTFVNTACSNCRLAQVSVNGGEPIVLEMPLSGQSWDLLFSGYRFSLDGFVPGPNNEVTFANPTSWAPDIHSLGIVV